MGYVFYTRERVLSRTYFFSDTLYCIFVLALADGHLGVCSPCTCSTNVAPASDSFFSAQADNHTFVCEPKHFLMKNLRFSHLFSLHTENFAMTLLLVITFTSDCLRRSGVFG